MIIANSVETKEALEKEGARDVELFENYSFDSYFKRELQVEKLENIAVISNHIPDEEKQAIELLKNKGYNVDIYGLEGTKVYITDEILSKYDAVITIGKTVQYAMSLKIPVYVYDIHGGPGYLNMENVEQCREKNFSGRGFTKKTANQIFEEIEKNFESTLNDLEKIKQYAYENFCFEKIFDTFVEKIELTKDIDLEKLKQDYSKHNRNILVSKKISKYIIDKYDKIINRRNEDIKYLQKEIESLQKEIEGRDKKILSIESSKSYKIYEKIRNIFRRNK